MSKHDYRHHRGCGGASSSPGMVGETDPRPQFQCSKCGDTWTCGKDGGPYAPLAPAVMVER